MGGKTIFLPLVSILSTTTVHAQLNTIKMECGNKSTGEIQTVLVPDEHEGHQEYRLHLNENGEIPVVVHYAYHPKAPNEVSVTRHQIDRMFEEANRVFGEPFHFTIDKMEAVEDESLLILEGDIKGPEYKAVYSMFREKEEDQFKLHVYFPFDAEEICGLSSFPASDEQGMIVASTFDCAGSDRTPKAQVLIHELGHFFNLHHTFHNSGSEQFAEHVVRDNRCKYQGDGFCDTPADYYPSYLYQVFSELPACRFDPNNPNNIKKLSLRLDPDGRIYDPSTTNYMSYFDNVCLNEFTTEQRAMLKQAFEYRTYQPVQTFSKFALYPNPANTNDNIKIKMELDDVEDFDLITYQIRIFNAAGQEVSNQTSIGINDPSLSTLQNIDMSFMASGTYLVNLQLVHVRTQKILYQQTEKLIIN